MDGMSMDGREGSPMARDTWKIWKRTEIRLGDACDASCRLDERTTVDRTTATILTTRVR
jgi:hypothetical protein